MVTGEKWWTDEFKDDIIQVDKITELGAYGISLKTGTRNGNSNRRFMTKATDEEVAKFRKEVVAIRDERITTEIAKRILRLVPSYPWVLKVEWPTQLLTIPEFNVDDLDAQTYHAYGALEIMKKEWARLNKELNRSTATA